MSEAYLYPPWKRAVENFVSKEHGPGTIIRTEWLMDQFQIRKPVTANDQKKASVRFVAQFLSFREELLESYNICLRTKPGTGYEVVHPKDQTQFAQNTLADRVHKAFKSAIRKMTYVDHVALNENEKRENTDALAKTATLVSMFNRRQLLGRE